MIITDIKLLNFRNYDYMLQEFSGGVNLLIGENASGKTNLLESIYTLANTKSFRSQNDNNLVKINTDGYYLKGNFLINSIPCSAEYSYISKVKTLKFNNDKIKKLREYIAKILIVLYNPIDLYIINESPVYRRLFINTVLCKIDVDYFVSLRSYMAILSQKKSALKMYRDGKIDYDSLEMLNSRLTEFGAYIVFKRMEFFKYFTVLFREKFFLVMNREYNLEVYYRTGCVDVSNYAGGVLLENIKNEIDKKFRDTLGNEIKLSRILAGVQQDDVEFISNRRPVKYFFSQGERKSMTLALKLAEIDYMRSLTGGYPIALFDDVFSELDETRQNFLVKEIGRGFQAIIADTIFNEQFTKINSFKKIDIKPK